ncbi:MAG: hypothetical protein ABR616_05750 [Dermatophilaceae bacterium]|nr:hypothetical protein [Intrasporangiaceae bacterium]
MAREVVVAQGKLPTAEQVDTLLELLTWVRQRLSEVEYNSDGGTGANVPAWVQPTGAHDAYVAGERTRHNDKVWISLLNHNVWEPGVSGWREETAAGEPSPWVQPTGAHDAYALGSLVTHNGSTWSSDIDANTYEPGVYGWTLYTP